MTWTLSVSQSAKRRTKFTRINQGQGQGQGQARGKGQGQGQVQRQGQGLKVPGISVCNNLLLLAALRQASACSVGVYHHNVIVCICFILFGLDCICIIFFVIDFVCFVLFLIAF